MRMPKARRYGERLLDRDEALAKLSEVHAAVLHWQSQGLDHPSMASRLGLDEEAIGPLIKLAEAKLQNVLEQGEQEEDSSARR
jgi:DNA-directed RNA polymerase specialized sigma24 family protein